MFQDIYKSAYDKIAPRGGIGVQEAQIAEWIKKEKNKGKKSNFGKVLRPVAAVVLTVCLAAILGVPAAAQNIPEFYEVLQRRAPGLAEYLIPIQKSHSSEGIVMNLEAVHIEDNRAEVLVSFTDEGEGDYIHGMADMYDSYHLYSYAGESNIGGCSFVEYNEEQDKAYFQIDLTSSDGTFDKSRMEFQVYKLLTDCQSYTEEISLENILRDCELKTVRINGRSGVGAEHSALENLKMPGDTDDPRPGNQVLDISLADISPDTMEVIGIAYMDGILRVQICRGNYEDADRHMNVYMLDGEGREVYPNMSVMWHDETAGEEVLLEEFYFVITEEQVEEYTLFGEGEIRDGCVKGDWSITFEVK